MLGGIIGWVCKDYKWRSAARKNKFMSVDGELFTVKKHKNEHVGGD